MQCSVKVSSVDVQARVTTDYYLEERIEREEEMEEEEYENAALLRRSFTASYGSIALPGEAESPTSSSSGSAPNSIFGRLKRSFRRRDKRDFESAN